MCLLRRERLPCHVISLTVYAVRIGGVCLFSARVVLFKGSLKHKSSVQVICHHRTKCVEYLQRDFGALGDGIAEEYDSKELPCEILVVIVFPRGE